MGHGLAASNDVLAAVQALEPLILAQRDEAERARHLPVEVVRGLQAAGVTRMSVPRAYGGLEMHPAAQFAVVEALSRIDGAVGWCSLIAASLGYFAAFLEPAAARELLADPGAIGAGAVRSAGRAERVAGGFRVTGRWPFASNARHAAWMFGGCTVLEGGVPQRDAAGRPRTVVCLFPAEDCVLLDTWLSTGLCGTGSVDFTVEDCFVPARLTFNPATSPLGQAGPLYRLRTMYLVSHGAVVLGISRAAIDATVALMAHKTRVTGTALRDEPYAQMAVAKAEALVASARAYCLAVIEAIWATAMAGDELGLRQRADFRLSILHAHDAATEAIDLLHHVSGGTSAYRSSPLDRPFRDMHAIRQHVVAAPKVQETVGRVYVGLPPDVPFL